MKAFQITLLVIDRENLGADGLKLQILHARYADDCLNPTVMKIGEADIGDWSDDHPLNSGNTRVAEYRRLFPDTPSVDPAPHSLAAGGLGNARGCVG